MKKALIAGGFALLCLVIYTQITIFAVPPIGAVPEGRTVIMLRLNKNEFH